MFESVLQAAWEGLVLVFSWPNIIYPIIGTLIAMVFAFLPGLSGASLMALAIPLTLGWEPLPIMLIFGAFVGGATFMGSITSILFNIPGRTSSAASLLDGYPMARNGYAKTAIGASASASALGSTFGVCVLVALMPFMRSIMLAMGPPEFMMLAVWGLTTIAVLARGSVLKGLIAAGLGLLLAFVGFDPRTAEPRFTFDTLYLRDGISLVPIFLGLFALAEMIDLVASNRPTISGKAKAHELTGSVWKGVFSVFKNFWLFIRCSSIGTVIGMIPGVGASVAGFVAYGHAVQSSGSDSGQFGQGDVRGVIAPEAANDAKDGGSLVPTLAFGIPGGTGTAMLLVALTLHGLNPGPEMMTTHLHLVFVLIWSMFFSNWLTSLIGVAAVNPLARMTVLPTRLIIPLLLLIATLGAYIHRGQLTDVAVAFLFGYAGYHMKTRGWPRVPLVLGLVLGPLFETNLHLTMRLQEIGRIDFWTRPIAMTLLLLTMIGLLAPFFSSAKRAARREATS